MSDSCSSCKYVVKYLNNVSFTGSYFCRRYPPNCNGHFSLTSEHEWCGEYIEIESIHIKDELKELESNN